MNDKVYVLIGTNIEDYMEGDLDNTLLVLKNKETAYSIAKELNKYSTLEAEMHRVLEKVCTDEDVIDGIIDKVFKWYHNGTIEFKIKELHII